MTVKPSKEEEEHFARIEYEKRRAMAAQRVAAMAEEEKKRLRDLHSMHCPKCGQDLITVNLHAVQVDKCPSCAGMWLDSGELEQLVDREGGGAIEKVLRIFR